MKQTVKGWLWVERGHSVNVRFNGGDEKSFPKANRSTHDCSAEQQAKDFITAYLGQDDWTLKQQGFLGYQIRVPLEKDVVPDGPHGNWGDLKAAGVERVLRRMKPGWTVQAEWFNGVLNVEVPFQDDDGWLNLVVGNANVTLGADVYLSIDQAQQGEVQEESIDFGIIADRETVETIAGAIAGAVEVYTAYVLPSLKDRKEMITDEG